MDHCVRWVYRALCNALCLNVIEIKPLLSVIKPMIGSLPADTMIITLLDETSASAIWTIWGDLYFSHLYDQFGFTSEPNTGAVVTAKLDMEELAPASWYTLLIEDGDGSNAPITQDFRTGMHFNS